MPYERGRRSRQTSTFMLDPDVRAFDEVLATSIDGIACWTAESGEGEGSLTIHWSLGEALATSGIQASCGSRARRQWPACGSSLGRSEWNWFIEGDEGKVRLNCKDVSV
ncbi:hypothetical protein [Dactylosporangium sp. NPDC051484]|uniref:hypothetical protein n=1 Tax=Dactylosporangium sp. NPDC051484 TaxID=3154942 RepID=UPI00344B0272